MQIIKGKPYFLFGVYESFCLQLFLDRCDKIGDQIGIKVTASDSILEEHFHHKRSPFIGTKDEDRIDMR